MSDRVLIVDDNAQNLKLARILLESEGYEVSTAPDAEHAVEAIAAFEPTIVLMDIQLPGMDGLELTRRLKRDPTTKHIAVVVVTAYAMKGDEEKARAAGCDGYVTKPIDADALLTLLGRLGSRQG